jgi:hypothetical protein
LTHNEKFRSISKYAIAEGWSLGRKAGSPLLSVDKKSQRMGALGGIRENLNLYRKFIVLGIRRVDKR